MVSTDYQSTIKPYLSFNNVLMVLTFMTPKLRAFFTFHLQTRLFFTLHFSFNHPGVSKERCFAETRDLRTQGSFIERSDNKRGQNSRLSVLVASTN